MCERNLMQSYMNANACKMPEKTRRKTFRKKKEFKCYFKKEKGLKCKFLKRMGLTGRDSENRRWQRVVLQKIGFRTQLLKVGMHQRRF